MTRALLAGGAITVALFFLPLILTDLELRAATEVLYLALFAVSFNLLFHYGGMLSFGHNVYFGLGGYAVALLLRSADITSLPVLFTIVALAGLVSGVFLGAICVRLKGGYFALLTLAIAQFFLVTAIKWRSVTQADDGLIVGRPQLSLLGDASLDLSNPAAMYYLALAIVAPMVWGGYFITRTPLGIAVLAVRENVGRAESIGYNTYLTKLVLFAISAALAALAGMLSVLAIGVVTPEVFSIATGGNVLIIAMLGGAASYVGPLVGALIYYILKDGLSQATEHWQFFMGVALVGVVLFAPTGAVGLIRAAYQHATGAKRK
jgi:branched-chain amino acid transport system permease protein